VGYALLTEAGKQLLAYALVSVEPIAQEATQKVPAGQFDALNTLLAELAGMHLANS
jgi:hypothetical protein